MALSDTKIGSYTGTGSAINIICGWVPDRVEIWNYTDGNLMGVWFLGMPDGSAIDIAAAVGSNASGAVSKLDSAALGAGFTAGTDYSTSAKVYYYKAEKQGQ